jgi:hypothetical protein
MMRGHAVSGGKDGETDSLAPFARAARPNRVVFVLQIRVTACGKVTRPSLTVRGYGVRVPGVGALRMEDVVDAKTYRERAIQARLGAKESRKPEFRAVFERLAESYEELARNAEWIEPSNASRVARSRGDTA